MMSSSVFNAVSISVSDSDSDETAAKLRVRARRRRKRPGIHGNAGISRRIVRTAVRWWPVLLFVPAVVLLVFEVSRTGGKSAEGGGPLEVVVHEEDSRGKLNRLDPTMRVVNGVREREWFGLLVIQFLPFASVALFSFSGQIWVEKVVDFGPPVAYANASLFLLFLRLI